MFCVLLFSVKRLKAFGGFVGEWEGGLRRRGGGGEGISYLGNMLPEKRPTDRGEGGIF